MELSDDRSVLTIRVDDIRTVTFRSRDDGGFTGGWSGNESVISALDGTMFNLRWWETTKRGGMYVYKVRADDWNSESNLGRFADLNSR